MTDWMDSVRKGRPPTWLTWCISTRMSSHGLPDFDCNDFLVKRNQFELATELAHAIAVHAANKTERDEQDYWLITLALRLCVPGLSDRVEALGMLWLEMTQ